MPSGEQTVAIRDVTGGRDCARRRALLFVVVEREVDVEIGRHIWMRTSLRRPHRGMLQCRQKYDTTQPAMGGKPFCLPFAGPCGGLATTCYPLRTNPLLIGCLSSHQSAATTYYPTSCMIATPGAIISTTGTLHWSHLPIRTESFSIFLSG